MTDQLNALLMIVLVISLATATIGSTVAARTLGEVIMADPWTTSLGQAEVLLEEIFAMPEHAALREWYT